MTASSPPPDPREQQWRESSPPPDSHQMPAFPPQELRPRTVEVSFWLWIGYLTLDVVFGIITLLTEDLSVVPGAEIMGFAVALLVDTAMFVFAFFMREGHNWARIALTVLGGLRLLVFLFALLTGAGGLLAVMLLVVGAAIVTMFMPDANPWFRSRQPAS